MHLFLVAWHLFLKEWAPQGLGGVHLGGRRICEGPVVQGAAPGPVGPVGLQSGASFCVTQKRRKPIQTKCFGCKHGVEVLGLASWPTESAKTKKRIGDRNVQHKQTQ